MREASKKDAMTPDEMRRRRIELTLSVEDVARWLKVAPEVLRAYEAGKIELPEAERFGRLIENTEWIRSSEGEE